MCGKTFTYYIQSSPAKYSEQTDEEFFDEEEIEYEVSYDRIREVLVSFVIDDYFTKIADKEQLKKSFNNFLLDNDLDEILEQYYEEKLKDYFELEARRQNK